MDFSLKLKRSIRKPSIVQYILSIKKSVTDKKLQKLREPYLGLMKELLPNRLSIISSNCFAGRIMQDLKIEYCSPTLGLWMIPDDFSLFCSDLKSYLNADIKIVSHSKNEYGEYQCNHWNKHPYPIGNLDNKLEIHFLHYFTAEEAIEKWKRRAARVNFEKILIIGSEQNGCTEEDIKAFDAIPYEGKLYFSSKPYPYKSVVYIPEFATLGHTGDPYKQGHIYYKYLVEWLKLNHNKIGKYK